MAGKKHYHKLISVLAVFLAATVFVFSNVCAFDVNENSSERKQIAKENKEYEKELALTEKEIAEKEKYSLELQKKIEALSDKIKKSNEKIKTLNSEIQEKQKQLDDRMAAIEDRLDLLRQRLRAIYTAGDVSALEVILQAKDFSDFIDKMELVQSMASYDDNLIKGLKEEMKGIGAQQVQLRKNKQKIEDEKDSLVKNKEKINQLSQENQAIIEELNSKKQDTESAIEENEKRQAELEAALRAYNKEMAEKARIQRELQKKREEERRKRLEEARKNNANNNNNNNNNNTDTDNTEEEFDDEEPFIDTTGDFVWPCPGHTYLTSTFDEWRGANNHGALDIADGDIYGAAVVACYYGTVIYADNFCPHDYGKSSSCGCGGGYGRFVMIDHGDGKVSIYGHLSDVVVESGQEVLPGQLIGYVGSTGYSTGPHLHFEMQYNGVRYDPLEEYS